MDGLKDATDRGTAMRLESSFLGRYRYRRVSCRTGLGRVCCILNKADIVFRQNFRVPSDRQHELVVYFKTFEDELRPSTIQFGGGLLPIDVIGDCSANVMRFRFVVDQIKDLFGFLRAQLGGLSQIGLEVKIWHTRMPSAKRTFGMLRIVYVVEHRDGTNHPVPKIASQKHRHRSALFSLFRNISAPLNDICATGGYYGTEEPLELLNNI